METYFNLDGIECVKWTDEQGTHSMYKSVFDRQQAEQSTPIVKDEPAAKK
jgi:hypothetical protein